MAVIIDKNQADEILKQYRKKYPEYWEKMKQHQAFWVMLRDKNLPEPDDIPTHEMIDFTNDNLHKIRDYIREIKLFAGVKPGEEPTEHFSDTYRFVKQRMEYLARAEVTKDL
jgi:hypothetical protein